MGAPGRAGRLRLLRGLVRMPSVDPSVDAAPARPRAFRAVVVGELVARGISVAELAAAVACRAEGAGVSRPRALAAHLEAHLTGRTGAPPPLVMSLAARTLGIAPERFAEYRLAQAREALDERNVGLEAALERLAAVEAALDVPTRRA